MGKFFVKAKTNNQKGATPMQSKLKPSQQKSKLIDQIISNKAYGGFEDLVTASVEHVLQEALEGEVTDHLGRQWYQPQKAGCGGSPLRYDSRWFPPPCSLRRSQRGYCPSLRPIWAAVWQAGGLLNTRTSCPQLWV
jgi:hypothetical protein